MYVLSAKFFLSCAKAEYVNRQCSGIHVIGPVDFVDRTEFALRILKRHGCAYVFGYRNVLNALVYFNAGSDICHKLGVYFVSKKAYLNHPNWYASVIIQRAVLMALLQRFPSYCRNRIEIISTRAQARFLRSVGVDIGNFEQYVESLVRHRKGGWCLRLLRSVRNVYENIMSL